MRAAMSWVALILFLCCLTACIVVPGAPADGSTPPQREAAGAAKAAAQVAAQATQVAQVAQAGGANNRVVSETRNVAVNGRTISASVIRANLADPATRVKVALGQDRVGGTEDLLALAQRKGAIAAINGTFFNAYVKSGTRDPVGTLITGGRMVHKGNTGTVFGITAEGEVRMDPVRFKIVGGTNGSYKWPNNWYAYFINRTPTAPNSVIIYTPECGATAGAADGISVVVRDGRAVSVGSGDTAIPGDGYVINFRGAETSLASRFQVATPVEYRIVVEDTNSPQDFWARVEEGLGAGPRLIAEAEIAYSLESAMEEGFQDRDNTSGETRRILSASHARSALGVNARGEILLVTVPGATMMELAQVMRAIGAVDAMNLDGGASSGLVYCGRYITRPTREVSNALLVF